MKKKTITAVLAAAAAGVLALSLGACSWFDVPQADANYPYDVAVEEGYTGSESEWLAESDLPSTHERRLYDEAVESGSFTGTYFEFLQQIGVRTDETASVNSALRSVVSVVATFNVPVSVAESGKVYVGGSGVICSLDLASGDAVVLTNYHVVYYASSTGNEKTAHVGDEIALYLYGGQYASRAVPATFLAGSKANDVALLSVSGSEILKNSDACAVKWGNSESLTVGERVYAVGNADNKGISVTGGAVSVLSEYIEVRRCDENGTTRLPEIRTDADVNHGNSGGGLFNWNGELVGIVNARSEKSDIKGFGYALPASYVLPLANNLFANAQSGGALAANAGFEASVAESKGVYNEMLGKYYVEEKVVAQNVMRTHGLAYRQGLKDGDTLISAKLIRSGNPVKETYITRKLIWDGLLLDVRLGDSIKLTVSRADEEAPIELTFAFSSSNLFSLYD